MGITVIPHCLFEKKPVSVVDERASLGEIALTGKYYRHPDSALISYPLAVEEPLGSINKPLNIAIIGGGAAGVAALYELSNLKNSSKNIRVTLYESDPEHFIYEPETQIMRTGLKAGRVCTAVSGGEVGGLDHAAYEVGAMRFPEIAGLTWHYASTLYGADTEVGVFPNPGTVPTEVVHGDRVDRFGNGDWLDQESPTRQVVEVIRKGLFGQAEGDNISLFHIGGQDPAKISAKLANKDTNSDELAEIYDQWKVFADKYDNRTLESAVRDIIEDGFDLLPNVPGLQNNNDKINYYVELFGTVGFGTGGFKPLYKMAFLEMMRLLLWNYSNEHVLPVMGNVHFIKDLYLKARQKNSNVVVKKARVSDVCHLEQNPNGSTMVVYYDVVKGVTESEDRVPQKEVYDYVILATTPKQTSYMISRIGFNNVPRRVILGDYDRPLLPENYMGYVRPALVLSRESEAGNSKLFTAINHVHMASSSKVFASIKRSVFESYAPEFLDQGKIKAILSDSGLGSSYVIPSTVLNEVSKEKYKDYYSILVSYSWEDDAKRLQHHFRKYPINKDDTKLMMNALVNRAVRYVTDPEDQSIKPWWFGEVLSKGNLEDALSYDWTTFNSSGAFKLDKTGDYYNSHLLFRYHTHALKPELKNKFFIANCSYSHLGGWVEGAFMSAVNAVCGLIVAANDGDVNALSPEARKVVESLDSVVEK